MINQQCQCLGAIWFEQLLCWTDCFQAQTYCTCTYSLLCGKGFFFKQLKCSIILSWQIFFLQSENFGGALAKFFAASLFWLIAQSNYLYFMEIPSSVTGFREQNKMDVYCCPLMYQWNRSFNGPPPPGQPPGHLNFWKIFVQIPPSQGQKAVQMPHPWENYQITVLTFQ